MSKVQKRKAGAATPRTAPVTRTSVKVDWEYTAVARLCALGAGNYFERTEFEDRLVEGSFELYRKLAPRDAADKLLALLAVSVTNASLDCLQQAARVPPHNLPLRELNLRLGLKGAEVATNLVKALDERCREKSDKVTVGAVNVEAGGQAIVGNVKSTRHPAPTRNGKK
jgi:hypothetical protein